jgi:hypothetical protein
MKAAAAELTAVIKEKSDNMLHRLDEEIARAEQKPAPAKAETKTAEQQRKPEAAPRPVPEKPAPRAAAPKPPMPHPQDWATHTKPNDAY